MSLPGGEYICHVTIDDISREPISGVGAVILGTPPAPERKPCRGFMKTKTPRTKKNTQNQSGLRARFRIGATAVNETDIARVGARYLSRRRSPVRRRFRRHRIARPDARF